MFARKTLVRGVLVLFVALTTGLATSGELRKLPRDFTFEQGEGSPGVVRFSHDSHVDADEPRCLDCHPSWFRILVKGTTGSGERITHEAMEKGARACGACHGRTAFGFDDCTSCHAE